MKAETKKMMDEMVAYARKGNEIYPMFYQPRLGINAIVSAAIRCAKKRGLIEQAGVDGMGNPKYRATFPQTLHNAPESIQ